MDSNKNNIKPVLGEIYGNNDESITIWWNRWRVFFIACSELFRYNNGNEWYVGHYLLKPK